MRRRPVLLKRESGWAEVPPRPWLQYVAEDSLLIAGGVDLDVALDEDQRRLSGGADPGPDHDRGRKMTAADDFRGRGLLLALLEQLAAILTVVERLDSENLLVGEEHFRQASTGEQTKHSARFLEPFRLHRVVEEMDASDLVASKPELSSGDDSDAPFADAELFGHLSHGDLRISLNPAANLLDVLRSGRSGWATASRTVHGPAGLLVAFYGVVDGASFETSRSNNVDRLHSPLVQLDDGDAFVFTRHNFNGIENRNKNGTFSRSKLHVQFNEIIINDK